jgi:hypothetical protein
MKFSITRRSIFQLKNDETKIFTLFIALWLIATTSMVAQTATAPSGSGTKSDPSQIASIENLYWLSQADTAWFAYYEQTANIDASETSSWDGEAGFSPIGNSTTKFTGNYNGKGYTIDSLSINRSSTDYVGMPNILTNSIVKYSQSQK